MMTAQRRLTGAKVPLLVAAVLLLLLGSLWKWVQIVAERKWAYMVERVDALKVEGAARSSERPVLRGAALPGNAWDEYALSRNQVLTLDREATALHLWVMEPASNSTSAQQLVGRHAALLDPLRRGVRRSAAQYPHSYDAMADPVAYQPEQSRWTRVPDLIMLGICKARMLATEGRQREAADLLLDLCQFSHDVGYNGPLLTYDIALRQYESITTELRMQLLAGRLSKNDLSEISRELERVDQSFPKLSQALMNELLRVGIAYQKVRETERYLHNEKEHLYTGDWKHFLAPRLLLACGWADLESRWQRLAAASTGPWATMRQLDGIGAGDTEEARLVQGIGGDIVALDKLARQTLVHLRLLRVIAHYGATGEVMTLDDPFGTSLYHSIVGNHLKVWSVGQDGTNDGGSGDWTSQGSDIVLEMDK